MDFMEETLLELLFLGQPRDRSDSLSWFSGTKKALFTNFWLTNSVTCFQFNLLVYCFTMVMSLIFCSRILKIAVRKIKVLLCHKSFCFCFWTPKNFKIVRLIAAYVQASVSWLTQFRLIAFMIGRQDDQSTVTRCSPTRSMHPSELSSKTRRHTSKSKAPISPSMKPIQMRRALRQILSKGKIQRPHSGKDSRSDKQSAKDTTDLKSQKKQARQKTMPVVIDKFKGVMCLVPDHLEDHLTFSQSDEPEAIRSRVRKPAALRGKAVRRRETTECSEKSKIGNETSITSITVEEATTELMSGNIRVIRHKYFAQTESSSAGAVQSASFVKVSRENALFCNRPGDKAISLSDREWNDRSRTKPRNEDGTALRYGVKSPRSQQSAQCCPGLHYIPVLAGTEQAVELNPQAPGAGLRTKRRREIPNELDLCKENERHNVRDASGPHREGRTRKTRKTKTTKRTGQHVINGVDKTYFRQGGTEAAESYKSCAQGGRGEKQKLTQVKSSASDSVSSGPVIAEVALSKSPHDVGAKTLYTPSHAEYESRCYLVNTASIQSNKSRGKLEHLNVSGFPDSLKSTERECDGILTKEAAKPPDTTPKSEEYPRWGSEALSDKVHKKVLYGAPEAKPPPGKPSPRKTFHEKETSDKTVADFKLCDKTLRTNLMADNTFFSKSSRVKLRPLDTGTDLKGASLYPTQFMSIFGMKHFPEDYISSGQNSSGPISSGPISSGRNSSEHISSGKMQPAKVLSGLRFDVTSLMPAPDPCLAPEEAPKVVSTPGSRFRPEITTKPHPQTVEKNAAAETIKKLTKEQATFQLEQTVLTMDPKDARFNVLSDSGRRVAVADQILNDAESIVTSTADDTKCFTEPKYKSRDCYEARQVKGQKATGAIRYKIGVRKYQPYTNPRLVKNETVLNHLKWYSSTALTQSSSSMKETRSSNDTKDTFMEERRGAAKNKTPLKSSMSRGDNWTTERTKRLTKQHPRFLLSRPRIGQNVEGRFEPKGPDSSADEKDVKSVKKHGAEEDPNSDDKSRKIFRRANSTDSSSDCDPTQRRMKLENGGKAPFFTHKRSTLSTTNIRMIEALPEESLGPPAGRAQSASKAGARKEVHTGELKEATDCNKDRGQLHRETTLQKDPASVIGSNSTQSGSKQTTASKRQSDDAISWASKKSRKDTERGEKLEANKVVLKSKTTRHVLSETVTSPRLGKDDGFKLRVAKTEGDLLELRKEREKRRGLDDMRVALEKKNTAAGVTIRRRIRKILSPSCEDVKLQPQVVNGKAKVSRIPIYVGASLTKSLSAVINKRDVQSLKQKATRSLTNNTAAHPHTRFGEAVAALRKGPLKVSGGETIAKDALAASQKSGHDSQRKSSINRLDKPRARDAINGAKPDESGMRMCRHFEESKSNFGKLTITGANQELKAVLPMLIDHSKDSIIIITPDTKVKQLTNIIENAGQYQPGVSGSRAGVQVKKRGQVDVVCNADGTGELHDTFTAHGTRHRRLAVTHEKGGQLKHCMPRHGVHDEDDAMIGSSFSGSALADEDVHTHIANKRLRHICSPQACRLCGTHTQDNTTCEMGKVDQMTSHQQYTMNTQKLLFRRTLTRQEDAKCRYDSEDAAADRKDDQINEYFIMHDAYRVFKRKKSPVVTNQDSAVSSVNDKHLQSDEDRASSMNSPQSSSPKMGKQPLHHQTRAAITYNDLETGKGKKRSKKSNASVKSSESRTVKSAGAHSPMPAKTETLLPDNAKNDDDESDVIQVVTYEDYHCRSESTTAPPGESPRIMSSPVPGYQRNTRSYSMKIAKESSQKVGSKPVQSDYIIDPEVQHYRISRIHKRKTPNPVAETTGKPHREDNFPTRQSTQDRQSKYSSAALQRKPMHLPANQSKKAIETKSNLPARFDEEDKNGWNAHGKLAKHPEMTTERKDSNRKSVQGIPDDRKYGEILHKAGETSRAWAKIRTGEAAKLREAKLKQVSSMGYKVTDGAVDRGRKGADRNIYSTTRKAADVTVDVAGRKLSEPAAAVRGRRTPHGLTDGMLDGALDKNDSDSSKLKQFYLKRNFAKLKNPITTITRQKANLRVLDALETKHHVRCEQKPHGEEPKPSQRLDKSTKDPGAKFLKGSVDNQTDSLLKGSTTGAANFERIACIPSTVRVKQTKTSLQRQRSSHLHHDFSQYMTFAWQADDKITKHREEKNPLTSYKGDDNRASFDELESSPDRTDPNLDEKDATHTLPRETSPKARRKKPDGAGERLAEQAKGSVMFVSNKSPIKTQSQIPEPNQSPQSHDKNKTDRPRGARIHYRNGRRIVLKETDDTAGVMDPPTQSSNIDYSRDDNVLTKEFDYSTTMPSTEAEMRLHNESKPRIKMSENSNTISRHQVKVAPDASRKTSTHILSASTKKCESNTKTLYSMKGDPKLWGLNKQRIAQNVRAVLSSADFEKVWKRIETTKSETGMISSEDQRWIVNQLLLGGTEAVQKSNSEPQSGDPKRVNENTYKIIHDKLHRPSSRVARNGSDEVLPNAGCRKIHDKTAMDVAVDCKQKEATRSPPASKDYMSEGRIHCTSSPHSNPNAIVFMGQKLYGNSMAIEISDKNDKDEPFGEILSDVDIDGSCRNYDKAQMKKKNKLCAKETEAATKSEMTFDDDTHDQTNTFPRRKKRRQSALDDPEETVCPMSEPQRKYLKPTEHARSTALASYIADIIPWVGHSRKGKQQLSTHLQKTISSLFPQHSQSGGLRTPNAKIQESIAEEATETIDDERKSRAAFVDDSGILRGEDGGVVNIRPRPDNPYRSPKSMTAVGNAANLYTQAWRKRSSSVLEINLGTIDEEVIVFPKSVSPAQMPEKTSAENLLDSGTSKTVFSTTAGDGLNPWSSHKREDARERTSEAAISLLEECLLRSASSDRCANAPKPHQSVNGALTGPASSGSKLKAGHDAARKRTKEADPSCDSRNSMWKFDDSPSTADIVISWLAQTNDTELSIGRLTDQDVSNGQLASSANHQAKSDIELVPGTAKSERRKQKSTSGITLGKGDKCGKSSLEEVKTDPLGERISSRKRAKAVEKEALKTINDVGPAWWLKQAETEAAGGTHFHKNEKTVKNPGKEESAKAAKVKSIIRGRGLLRDRAAWPQVSESKIAAWKRSARKRVEPISDQHPSSQGANERSVPNDDADKVERKSSKRFDQTSSVHKLTPNKSTSKLGNRDPHSKDDALARPDNRNRYGSSHHMRPAQSIRHGTSNQSKSLHFFSKSDSSTGIVHGPPGKDQTGHRHAARNVTENNNLQLFPAELARFQSVANEEAFCNGLFHDSDEMSIESGTQSSTVVGWNSTDVSRNSNLDPVSRETPDGLQGSSPATQHNNPCSKSEASIFSRVSFDWYKPLTAPFRSTCRTGEVSGSDQVDTQFFDSIKSVGKEESRSQSSPETSSGSSGTCSTVYPILSREHTVDENEKLIICTHGSPGSGESGRGGERGMSGGRKNREDRNEAEETSGRKGFSVNPGRSVETWGCVAGTIGPLGWDTAQSGRGSVGSSYFYPEKSPQRACSVNRSVKHACSVNRSVKHACGVNRSVKHACSVNRRVKHACSAKLACNVNRSAKHACSVNRSAKHACSVKRSVKQLRKGTFLPIGDELRFNHTLKAGREKAGRLEDSAGRTESLTAPSEITRQAELRLGAEGCGDDRGPCSWVGHGGDRGPCSWVGHGGDRGPCSWVGHGGDRGPCSWVGHGGDRGPCSWVGHDCRRDCEDRQEGDGVTQRDLGESCGQADSTVRPGGSLETPESWSGSSFKHDHLFNDLGGTYDAADLHSSTADVESYSKRHSSRELPTSECCSTSPSECERPPNQPSGGGVMTSSLGGPTRPPCGFSYLYNHDTATPDPPTGAWSSYRPVFLRVRPPKANTMVGQLVKMFEKRLTFRQRPDVTY